MIKVLDKICRNLRKLRLQPIQVYVFHQVSNEWDSLRAWECDWTQIDVFKEKLLSLKTDGVEFISIEEAKHKLESDFFRFKKYSVLTNDDGYATLKNIIPWLEEQKIPLTIFVNGKYLDGKSWSPINEEQALRVNPNVSMKEVVKGMYLTKKELFSITSPLVSVGLHGYEHLDATTMSADFFEKNVDQCVNEIVNHPRYIPYYAYTWGHHNNDTDMILQSKHIIPVLVNGENNYKYSGHIDRKWIDGISN